LAKLGNHAPKLGIRTRSNSNGKVCGFTESRDRRRAVSASLLDFRAYAEELAEFQTGIDLTEAPMMRPFNRRLSTSRSMASATS
jgi:hypothetical protein